VWWPRTLAALPLRVRDDRREHTNATRCATGYRAPPMPRALLVVLLLANVIVLLGQLWPEGAPPFARTVNIATLAADVVAFTLLLRRRRAD
jgi:hypothetical protein